MGRKGGESSGRPKEEQGSPILYLEPVLDLLKADGEVKHTFLTVTQT